MKYWVVKGRPGENDFARMLRPKATDRWRTRRPPKDWTRGDRLFFWKGTPAREVVGLGEFARVVRPASHERDCVFVVRYSSRLLESPVGINQLRRDRILHPASFLKPGPSGTVFPLTGDQGEHLYRLASQRNPAVRGVWPELEQSDDAPLADLELEKLATEGRLRLGRHLRRERKSWLVADKKQEVKQRSGGLYCEVCTFDFAAMYGRRGEDYCEVHHRRPLSLGHGSRPTSLEDLAIVCANCHRMLHRSPWIAVEELRRRIAKRHRRSEDRP